MLMEADRRRFFCSSLQKTEATFLSMTCFQHLLLISALHPNVVDEDGDANTASIIQSEVP